MSIASSFITVRNIVIMHDPGFYNNRFYRGVHLGRTLIRFKAKPCVNMLQSSADTHTSTRVMYVKLMINNKCMFKR